MKKSLLIAATALGLGIRALPAHAQDTTLETSDVPPLDADVEPGFDDGRFDSIQPLQQPSTEAPNETPQLPTTIPPPPESQQKQQQNAAPVAVNGQWVFTQQYGWVYAPYEQQYTYVTDDVSTAWMFMYRPVVGWSWLGAPWVIATGPRPFWGNWGPYRYAYYANPWFRPRAPFVHYYGRPRVIYHTHPGPRAYHYYHAPFRQRGPIHVHPGRGRGRNR